MPDLTSKSVCMNERLSQEKTSIDQWFKILTIDGVRCDLQIRRKKSQLRNSIQIKNSPKI